MNYKTLVAASLMSIALTSAAFAQCTDCALYPDRDYLNKGVPTPASKMMTGQGGAVSASNGARVSGRQYRHPHDANASIGGGYAPADTPAHRVYIQNLRDSGYSPARDFDAGGNIKVN